MTHLEDQLAKALRESVEWNWLDEESDPPACVTEQISEALSAYEQQKEREQNNVSY